jgi:UNC-50 family
MSSDLTLSPRSAAAHVRKSARTASDTIAQQDPLSVSAGNAESTMASSSGVSSSGNASSAAGLLSSHHHHHSNPRTSQQPQTLFHPHSSFWHRWWDVRQMDLQSALDQMKTLLSTRPQTIYKTAYYRKQTKNHWYRDDPAFCLVQITFLLLASMAYSIAFQASLLASLSFIFTSIVWNYVICGIIMASVLRELANRHLIQHHNASQHVQRQQVEWLYAFDIHCNAFFPLFVVLCTYNCSLS